jgi:hypothetical protein
VWISSLISMASTCYQPITHSSADASIVNFSKPLPPYDASWFGCSPRFNLSAMDLPAPMELNANAKKPTTWIMKTMEYERAFTLKGHLVQGLRSVFWNLEVSAKRLKIT